MPEPNTSDNCRLIAEIECALVRPLRELNSTERNRRGYLCG
jgi:hypothetical protein